MDARELPDAVLSKYLHLLEKEIAMIKPKVVILFGNQVSSIVLDEKISVSKVRKQCFLKEIDKKTYKCYSVYYPVGMVGLILINLIEDIKWIIEHELNRVDGYEKKSKIY